LVETPSRLAASDALTNGTDWLMNYTSLARSPDHEGDPKGQVNSIFPVTDRPGQ
jgi:hypothetical protein